MKGGKKREKEWQNKQITRRINNKEEVNQEKNGRDDNTKLQTKIRIRGGMKENNEKGTVKINKGQENINEGNKPRKVWKG